MEHHRVYPLGRYRLVERIEKVEGGYQRRVTAYDDEMTRVFSEIVRVLSAGPAQVIRFDVGRLAATLADARRELDIAVKMMKDDIAREPLE